MKPYYARHLDTWTTRIAMKLRKRSDELRAMFLVVPKDTRIGVIVSSGLAFGLPSYVASQKIEKAVYVVCCKAWNKRPSMRLF